MTTTITGLVSKVLRTAEANEAEGNLWPPGFEYSDNRWGSEMLDHWIGRERLTLPDGIKLEREFGPDSPDLRIRISLANIAVDDFERVQDLIRGKLEAAQAALEAAKKPPYDSAA